MIFNWRTIWQNAPTISRTSFYFRLLSYGFSIAIILVQNHEINDPLKVLDYLAIFLYVITPFALLIHHSFYNYNRYVGLKHSSADFILVGLLIGLLNFSILPTFILFLVVLANEVAAKGFKTFYKIAYLLIAAALPFILDQEQIRFGYSDLVAFLVLAYGAFHVIILSYISYIYARELHYKQKLVETQREEIQIQSEELNSLNETLIDMNHSLEQAVDDRTKELKIKNRQLAEYAFINAHKLRAPIATLQGLLNLIDKDAANQDIILEKIKESIEVLVLIVTDIRIKLEREEGIRFKED